MKSRSLLTWFAATLLFSGAAIAGDEKNTEVVHREFSLLLPGEWTLVSEPAEDFWQYQSKDGSEGVTIGLYGRPGAPDKRTMRRDLDTLISVRRNAEVSVADMHMQLGKSKITKANGVLYSFHWGASEDGEIHTMTRIAMNQRIAVSVFYEVHGLEEKDLEENVNRGVDLVFSLELTK